MQGLATGSAGGLALVACGLFYALLCVFSIVTGALYVLGKRELNPLELSDRFVEHLGDEDRLQSFARTMGFVTIVVGIVQGASAWAILAGRGMPAYSLALGFTLFSLASVLFKLRGKVSAFPLLKLVAYLAILAVLLMGGTRARFLASGQAQAGVDTVAATETTAPAAADHPDPVATRSILVSWNQECEAYQRLTAFVEDVCDPASDGYLPPEERIATFDMDGTFICERAPIYVDQVFATWHVLEDPTYKAPAKRRARVESVMDEVNAGIVPERVNLNTIIARCYQGHTPAELEADVLRFASQTPVKGFDGMTYAESFYRPMVEVITYLRANDFDVWVVTACERYVSRALVVEYVGFDPTHVVGTDYPLVATGQGGEEGIDYTFTQDDTLVIAGPLLDETGKTNKVIAIENEIGRRPVLSFGNSSGDFAMLNYASSNPDHQGLGFLVVADDLEREYGNEEKATSMREEIDKQGWVGISMRDDWTTIYGEGVEKTSLPELVELADAA